MTSSVEAAYSQLKSEDGSPYSEPTVCSERTVVLYSRMTKVAKGGVPSEKRAGLRHEIGDRIKKVRKLYDGNRTRYAEEYSLDGKPVHHTTWRLWEEGLYMANPEVMVDFCDRTGATMDYIYRGILSGVDEDLKAALFEAYPEVAAAYRAELASRRAAPAPLPAPPPPAEPTKRVVPNSPAEGRRRPGPRQLPEKKLKRR
jgi:hypothetical protein